MNNKTAKTDPDMSAKMKLICRREIENLYRGYAQNSLLGRALTRILASQTPLDDLAILNSYVDTMPDDEYRLFSGSDIWQTRVLSVGSTEEDTDLILNFIKPYRHFLDDKNTFRLVFSIEGQAYLQPYNTPIVTLDDWNPDIFHRLAACCGIGIEGGKTHSVTLPDLPFMMNYGANGGLFKHCPVIIFKRSRNPVRSA